MLGAIFSAASNLIPGVGQVKVGATVLKYVLIIGIPLAICGGVYFTYRRMESRIETLTTQVQKDADAKAAMTNTIAQQDTALSAWAIRMNKYQADVLAQNMFNQTAEQAGKNLTNVFSKHDLTTLSLRKPAAVERRVNSGTLRAFSMLQCASDPTSTSCGATTPSGNASSPSHPHHNAASQR